MLSERKDYEAVRYQLKRIVGNEQYGLDRYTNDEIRIAAQEFEDFEPKKIAEKVIANRQASQIVQQGNSESALNAKRSEALTIADKHSLTKIQASQMGIVLSDSEVARIVTSANDQITDTIGFLIEVKELIQAYLNSRNQKFQRETSAIVQDISEIINASNVEIGVITEETNETLKAIVEECNQANRDYKSPYVNRLESIREVLKIS